MSRLGTVVLVLVVLLIGVAFFRGWIAMSSPAPEAGSNQVNINFAADPDKVKQDAEIVQDKATELTGGVREDVTADGQADDMVESNDPE